MGFLSSKHRLNFHIPRSRLFYKRSLSLQSIWLSHHSVFSPHSSIADSAFSSFQGGFFPLYFLAVVLISENTYYLRNLRQPIFWDISCHPFEKWLMQLQTVELVFQCVSAVIPPHPPLIATSTIAQLNYLLCLKNKPFPSPVSLQPFEGHRTP